MANATRTEERKDKSTRTADEAPFGASDTSLVNQKQPQFYAYIVSPSWRLMRAEFIAELSQELTARIRRQLDDSEAEVALEIDGVKESMSLSQRLWHHPDAYIVVLSENGKQYDIIPVADNQQLIQQLRQTDDSNAWHMLTTLLNKTAID